MIHEPASLPQSYTNYVKAVPDSLFNNQSKLVQQQYAGKIPTHPNVFNFYHYNRVINIGSSISSTDQKTTNVLLNEELRTLGPSKQVNIVVILTSIQDPSYRFAVENNWIGGKKNDVVVFVGLDKNQIVWADVMTWALNKGNEMFHVTLRDDILDLKEFNPTTFVPVVIGDTKKLYDRPHMKDFQYLEDQIEPPTWVIWLAIALSIGCSIGLTIVFHKYELGG